MLPQGESNDFGHEGRLVFDAHSTSWTLMCLEKRFQRSSELLLELCCIRKRRRRMISTESACYPFRPEGHQKGRPMEIAGCNGRRSEGRREGVGTKEQPPGSDESEDPGHVGRPSEFGVRCGNQLSGCAERELRMSSPPRLYHSLSRRWETADQLADCCARMLQLVSVRDWYPWGARFTIYLLLHFVLFECHSDRSA